MPGKPLVGVHISIEKSLDLAFERAQELGCTTMQIFTRSPRIWKFKPIAEEQVASFRERRSAAGFEYVVDHMPYLPNLASSDQGTMKASRASLSQEVERCDALGIDYLVAHLGSHLGDGVMRGVRNVSDAVDKALGKSGAGVTVLLENMAGQKNSVGSRFEELRLILDRVRSERVGVCFDTAHAFAAGFDLSGGEAVAQSMSLFEDSVGLDRLKVVHLNDSKAVLGSNLDRHEDVGKGKIGLKGMKAFVGFDGISQRPLIMEVPYDDIVAMRKSIKLVKSFV